MVFNRKGLIWRGGADAREGAEGWESEAVTYVVIFVFATRVDVAWGCEMGFCSSNAVGQVDVKGTLTGFRARLLAVLTLEQETEELLALHLVFGHEVVGFTVRIVSVHSVTIANDVNTAECIESESKVDG